MFGEIKKQNRAAFIPFLVAGYPSLQETERLIDILVSEGADIIELGVPFSDALADGPVIQKASESTAFKIPSVFSVLELSQTIHQKHPKLGLVLFSYFNPLLKAGLKDFSRRARESGINTLLTVDLPPEEADEYLLCLRKEELGSAFLVSPTTSKDRIPLISAASSSFVYYVSRAGVTGVQSQLSPSLKLELVQLREQIQKPIVVGFGISSGVQAAQVAPLVDGVAVGSAFVKIITEAANFEESRAKTIQLARDIKQGLQNRRSP